MPSISSSSWSYVAKQMGYEAAAAKIQDAFLSGRSDPRRSRRCPTAWSTRSRRWAVAERIRDRLQAWKEAGKTHEVGSMLLSGVTVELLRVVAEAVL